MLVRTVAGAASLNQGEGMAFVIHTTRSVSQSTVRMLTTRQILLAAGSACFILAGVSFWAGWYLGQGAGIQGSSASLSTANPVRDRFALDRIGEVAGRLVTLESEARSLLKKLSALETLDSRLAELRAGKAVTPPRAANANANGGLGGQAFAAQPCLQPGAQAEVRPEVSGAEASLACLKKVIEKVSAAAASRSVTYMSMPIQAPVSNAQLGSSFGNRIDPFNGRIAFHAGLDYQAPTGTPIHAAGGGRIKIAGWMNDLGNIIEIDHGNGLTSRYAHTSKMFVKVGDLVAPGQLIANVGSTGRSTGPHLHFEVLHDGKYVDPAYYIEVGSLIPNA